MTTHALNTSANGIAASYAACYVPVTPGLVTTPVSASDPGAGWLLVDCADCLSASALHFNPYTHPATATPPRVG